MSDWKVELADENNTSEFHVEFHGPKDSECAPASSPQLHR